MLADKVLAACVLFALSVYVVIGCVSTRVMQAIDNDPEPFSAFARLANTLAWPITAPIIAIVVVLGRLPRTSKNSV